jgi:hypothetical protein
LKEQVAAVTLAVPARCPPLLRADRAARWGPSAHVGKADQSAVQVTCSLRYRKTGMGHGALDAAAPPRRARRP